MHKQAPIEFINRLENWGAYYRMTGSPLAASATWQVCHSLARDAGQTGYKSPGIRREIDEDDARIIEWRWSRSSYRMDKKHHAMLKAHYINRMDPRVICRHLHVRYLSYETELQQAVSRFAECVKMLEAWGNNTTSCKQPETGYNSSHQLLTTA